MKTNNLQNLLGGGLKDNLKIIFTLGFFVLVFLLAPKANAQSSYWKNYFSIEEKKAVQKNAEKYTREQIESKSTAWKGLIRSYNIKNGTIEDDDIKDNGIGTDKISGLGDYIDGKISGSSTPQTPQDFSADNLTGSYAALDGSQITNLNPTNISSGIFSWASGQTFPADKLTGTLPALNGSQLTNLNPSNITGSGNLNIGNGDLFLDDASGNVGIGTTSPSYPFQITNTRNIPVGTLLRSGQININATTQAGDINVQGTRALEINTNLYGTYDTGTLSGVYSNVYNNQTAGNITHEIALVGNTWNKSTGTVLGMYPIYGKIFQDAAGTITDAATIQAASSNISAGIVTSLNGLSVSKPNVTGTGSVTNFYGIKTAYSTSNVATNNNIDLSINGNPVGPVNAAIYVNAGANPSYFYSPSTFVKTTISGNATAANYTGLTVQAVQANSGAYQTNGTFSEAVSNVSSGTLSELRGVWGQARHGNTGTITAAYGLFSSISNASSGTIANSYGAYISTPTNPGGGIITRNIGLFIASQNVGNSNWAIYQPEATDKNYFAGSVGVGVASPVAKLDVDGEIKMKIESAQPFACDATHNGTIALTSGYRTCVCKGGSTTWVFTTDGTTSCTW
ncbi:MAG: hypothetical protein ACD_7C00047G0004 [uncultured bacterium]|nr:MAG: hypothetical protein ACD_7C00047G0004 [uncultured bacterium]HBR79776.1 hypothetical protein [Candidatus Moranbacteria bacterium]